MISSSHVEILVSKADWRISLEIVVGEWQNEDPTEKITEMAKADDQAAAQIC